MSLLSLTGVLSQTAGELLDAALVQTMTRDDLYFCSAVALKKALHGKESMAAGGMLPPLAPQSRRKALEFVRDLVAAQAPSSLPYWRELCDDFCAEASNAPPPLKASTSEQGRLFRKLTVVHKVGDCVDLGDATVVKGAGKTGEGQVEGGEGEEGRGVLATRRIEQDVSVSSCIDAFASCILHHGSVIGSISDLMPMHRLPHEVVLSIP